MISTVNNSSCIDGSVEGRILNRQLQGSYNRFHLQSFIDQYGIIKSRTPTINRIKNHLNKFYNTLSCISIINALLDRIPIIRCLKEYKIRKYLFGDIIAGITVAIMHIPQGMAYGILTTLPPVYGLYVSFFPVLLYMVFGTCPHLSLGTFAITSLMTGQVIDGASLQSLNVINNQSYIPSNISDAIVISEKVGLATTLAFVVGIIQLILSVFRLGFLTVYLTEPFISGFMAGAAVHVFSSQIPSVFGVKSPPKHLNDRYKSTLRIVIPSELILIVIDTIISHFTKFHNRHGVSVVGPIKQGLPAPISPPFKQISYLVVHAVPIAMVTLCISISMAKMFSRKHNYKVSSNQELLAYGISNTISSFFQCFPSGSSMSRSAVQEGSGCQTQLVGGFSCLVLGIVLVALTPLFQSLPMACLAAIIIVNLKGLLFQIKDFFFYYRISIMECLLWLITFVTVILFEVDIGLYVGLGASFLINTIRTQRPRFTVLGQIDNTEIYKNVKLFPIARQFVNIKILRFDESLYACNAPFFKQKFYELIGIQLRQEPLIPYEMQNLNKNEGIQYKYVVLECSPFNFIDTVGVKVLIEIYNDLKKRGIQLYLSECRYGVRHTFELMNFCEKTAPNIIYVTTHDAVMFIRAQSNNDLLRLIAAARI
ncbi:unnamed protein product [Rotaria sordida]|uniref:STAS domain-containing protein n=2 Tax=Rotaria sordida TaxID=392033 RepID=A0A814L7J1_9BILA|nr:unnamed protein product [Rotaria sordida]